MMASSILDPEPSSLLAMDSGQSGMATQVHPGHPAPAFGHPLPLERLPGSYLQLILLPLNILPRFVSLLSELLMRQALMKMVAYYHDGVQTCAKVPKRSKIQDPLDPRSGIQVDLGSSISGFVKGSRGSWIQHCRFCERSYGSWILHFRFCERSYGSWTLFF